MVLFIPEIAFHMLGMLALITELLTLLTSLSMVCALAGTGQASNSCIMSR